MADFPEAGVRLVAETDDAMSSVDSLASELDNLTSGSYLVTLETEVDTSGLDGSDLPTDGETITQTIDVDETEDSKSALDALNVLKNTAIIETVWNIAGTAVDLFKQFGGQILGPMTDLDEAVAKVNAQTASGIPDARKLIHDIFYDDLGESIGQVGDMVIAAQNMKLPLDEAVRSAFTFTHTFTDQNPQQVLNTMNQMVVNKLTPDFKTAGDVLVTAFQNGANRGNDLLAALEKNATAIHNMGLTGPEALSFIKTGLDNGFTSAEQVLTILEKIKQNVTNAAGNYSSDVTKTLRQLGIANPAETGEAWSAEFFQSVVDKISTMPGLTDTEREKLFSNLVGEKQGGKTFAAFMQISSSDADTIFANVGGAAERAAAEADNHLKGAFDDFQLAVSAAVQNWLSSSEVDIPGKLNKLKEGLQAGLNTLAEGGTLSDALTVALKPIGFDDDFRQLESILGNFVIAILQAVASIQDFTGHGAEATGTRATVEQLGKQQLAFDLSIANPDEIATAVATATSRGLSASEVTTQVSGIIDKLVKDGTKESLAQAQIILDQFKTNAPNLQVAQGLNGEQISQAAAALADGGDRLKSALEAGIVVDVSPNLTPENATVLQEKINAVMREAPPPDVIDALTASMGLQEDKTKKVSTAITESLNPMDKITDNTRDLGDAARRGTPYVADTSDAIVTVAASANIATTSLQGMNLELQGIINTASELSAASDEVAAAQQAILNANTTGTGGGTNPDSGGPSLMAGLMAYIMGGFIAGGGSVSNTINNNNNIPNAAVADALGYRQAAQLRGMGSR